LAFATVEDVEARRGGPLSESEEVSAEFLLEAAQGLVEEAVERDEAEIVALKGSVPPVLRFLVVERVLKAMANPQGLASQSEALGAYSHTERFNSSANSELMLSSAEERLARKAVYGKLAGTGEMESPLVSEARVGS